MCLKCPGCSSTLEGGVLGGVASIVGSVEHQKAGAATYAVSSFCGVLAPTPQLNRDCGLAHRGQ